MEINTALAIGILFVFVICCLVGCIIGYKKRAEDNGKNLRIALHDLDYTRYERDLTKEELKKANDRIEMLEAEFEPESKEYAG